MGVKGLSAFIKANYSGVTSRIELPEGSVVVIDGNAFVFWICQQAHNHQHIDAEDYAQLAYLSESYILRLLHARLQLAFVFDGGIDERKLTTKLSRYADQVRGE